MSALHAAVARAIADALRRAQNEDEPSVHAAAAAAIGVVREHIAKEEVPGIVAVAQHRERARVLAEAKCALERVQDDCDWRGRDAIDMALAALTRLGKDDA